MNDFVRTFTGLLAGIFLALALTTSPSWAQTARYMSQDASTCDIFRGLSRTIPMECATPAEKSQFRTLRSLGPTRGLVIYEKKKSVKEDQGAGSPAAKTSENEESKDLTIAVRAEFEFDSHELTPAAKAIIDRVAEVLNHDLMQDMVIEIQGHADASGAESYNMSLSEKRALAVKEYLEDQHEIDSSRLNFVGKGESEPFDPANPEAGINRRVEFKNVNG